MKFFMSIAVCSFLDFSCMPYVQYPIAYESWNTCMNAAYEESIKIMSALDQDVVERNRLATKFTCNYEYTYMYSQIYTVLHVSQIILLYKRSKTYI